MVKLDTRSKVVWVKYQIIFVLGLISCCHYNLLGQDFEPVDIVNRVADRIVAQSSFTFDYKPAAASAEYTYRFDFADVPAGAGPADVVIHSEMIIDPDVFDDQGHYELALSHSPGVLRIQIGDQELLSISDGQPALTRADYELLTYQNYLSLDKILDQKAKQLPIRLVLESNSLQVPKFYISVVEAESRMVSKYFRLENAHFDDASTVFTLELPQFGVHKFKQYLVPAQPLVPHLKAPLNYTDWRYYTGTFLTAMQDASGYFSELDYSTHLSNFFTFFNENVDPIARINARIGRLDGPFTLYYRFKMLDDFGPQATALLEHLWTKHQGDLTAIKAAPWFNLVEQSIQAVRQAIPRLQDGTLARITPATLTVQSDDLFMAGILLIRAGIKLQQPELIEEAVQQTLNFHNYLFNKEKQLYHHAYFSWDNTQSCCHWGRGLGWMMLIYAELLEVLPTDHPKRAQLIRNFQAASAGLLKVQGEDGRWHQILDDPSTYYETSATAMFIRAFAAGVSNNWYPAGLRKEYRQSAIRAWTALQTQVSEQGEVQGIVRGTPIFQTADEYANWTARSNDPRGLGAFIWAAIAIDKLK